MTGTTQPMPADTEKMQASFGHQGVAGARSAAGGSAQSTAGERTVTCLPCGGGQAEPPRRLPPLTRPVAPMAGTRVTRLPAGPGWVFKPKFDGFVRHEVHVIERGGRPLRHVVAAMW